MKTCTTCGKTKTFEAYVRDSKSMDGYRTQCRDCINARRRARRALTGIDSQVLARREEAKRRREEYMRLYAECRSNARLSESNREDPKTYPIKLAIFERRLALMDLRGVDEIREGMFSYDRRIVLETIEWLRGELAKAERGGKATEHGMAGTRAESPS